MVNKRDPEATRASLLEAAEAVFVEKGFGNTTLSEIARRSGITKSLIHHYFGSKENLWQEVKHRRIDRYADEQMDMLEDAAPSDDLLRDSLSLYFRFLKANPEIVRILAWMFLERDTDVCVEKHDILIAQGVERIRSGQRLGIIREDLDARFVLFTFLGLAQHWFQDKEHFIADFGTAGMPDDLDEAYLADMLEIFLGGVLVHPKPR